MKHVSNGSMIRWVGVSALGFVMVACAVEDPDGAASADNAGLATGSTCGIAQESTQTTLSCPSGTISKVVFASYGTPRGACGGTFTKSACNSATSQSVVEAACLGKTSCTLSAVNGAFGDPCVGTTKRLAVQIECQGAAPAPTPTPTPTPIEVLPIPTGIANGATVSLQCGRTYQGSLNLAGKSNVTVKTVGTCGKASITPGRAVTGWTLYKGNIYSAPIGFAPVQVAVAGKPVDSAHWPNRPQIWANPGTSTPSSDLAGATLVSLENQSVIRATAITGNALSTSTKFYVEGKLWMLDVANEWAVSNGRLYVWAADGLSPEGRVWAAPNSNGIIADNSTNIAVSGVRIFSAFDGISADTSSGLHVTDTEIANSARDGIWASGSSGLAVAASSVINSRRNGIDGWYWVTGATITNTTVTNSGMVGMPSETGAGIMFGDGSGNLLDNVTVTNSGYHGISVLHNRNTTVSNSVVDTACVTLNDCGGIYTGARDKLPLNLHIQANKVRNVRATEGIAIYLDDFSNGVTVTGNSITDSTNGVSVHNGFDNVITYNTFSGNTVMHVGFGQDSGNIHNNKVTNNVFHSTAGVQTFNLQASPSMRTFATFDYNTYTSTTPVEFARTWDGSSPGATLSYGGWKSYMGQDQHSTMNGAP